MEKLIKSIICISIIFICISCSKTEKDIDVKKALQYQVNKESKGLLALEEFEIVKGEKKASNNKMAYLVSYKAKVKAKKELEFGQSLYEPFSRYIAITPEEKRRSFFQPARLLGKKDLKEGDTAV